MHIPVSEVDLKVNRHYRIRIDSEGEAPQATGVYREIKSPEKLVLTWLWEEGGIDIEETLLTVGFRDAVDSNTEVVLPHELLPDKLGRSKERSCLNRIAGHLVATQTHPRAICQNPDPSAQ